MNQIILVGNGFDIAHNLKTRYRDFILDLLKEIVKEGVTKVGKNIKRGPISFRADTYIHHSPYEYVDQFSSVQDLLNDNVIHHNLEGEHFERKSFDPLVNLNFEQGFVKDLVTKFYDAKWVDIETEFYNHLKVSAGLGEGTYDEEGVQSLVEQMAFLRNSLKAYLQKVSSHFDFDSIKDFDPNFLKAIRNLIFAGPTFSFAPGSSTEPTNYKRLIVNFNYLNTIEPYLEGNNHGYPTEHINIHGTIDDEIIFGYGDVESPDYRTLLQLGNKFLRHSLKNFRYPSSNTYLKLSNLLDNGEFLVQVVGHSCGASDGTTLRKIFDHKNCRSIRLCYLDNDEFDDKVIEIARHCTDQFINDKIYPRNQKLKFPRLSSKDSSDNS